MAMLIYHSFLSDCMKAGEFPDINIELYGDWTHLSYSYNSTGGYMAYYVNGTVKALVPYVPSRPGDL